MANRKTKFINSSGNIFADLGLPEAEELNAKARLGVAITRAIQARGLTQKRVADLLNLTQPKVSALLHYKLDGFSVERLMNLLTFLTLML